MEVGNRSKLSGVPETLVLFTQKENVGEVKIVFIMLVFVDTN